MATSHVVSDTPACPVCCGRMWDNRRTKRNPKAPDFRCRDRSCTGVIWHYRDSIDRPGGDSPPSPRRGQLEPIAPVVARVLASIGTDPSVAGSPSPEKENDAATPGHESPNGPPCLPRDPAAGTRALYRRTVKYVGRHVIPLCGQFGLAVSSDTFAAMVATLFIALYADTQRTPMGPPEHLGGGRRHG